MGAVIGGSHARRDEIAGAHDAVWAPSVARSPKRVMALRAPTRLYGAHYDCGVQTGISSRNVVSRPGVCRGGGVRMLARAAHSGSRSSVRASVLSFRRRTGPGPEERWSKGRAERSAIAQGSCASEASSSTDVHVGSSNTEVEGRAKTRGAMLHGRRVGRARPCRLRRGERGAVNADGFLIELHGVGDLSN